MYITSLVIIGIRSGKPRASTQEAMELLLPLTSHIHSHSGPYSCKNPPTTCTDNSESWRMREGEARREGKKEGWPALLYGFGKSPASERWWRHSTLDFFVCVCCIHCTLKIFNTVFLGMSRWRISTISSVLICQWKSRHTSYVHVHVST